MARRRTQTSAKAKNAKTRGKVRFAHARLHTADRHTGTPLHNLELMIWQGSEETGDETPKNVNCAKAKPVQGEYEEPTGCQS